MDWSAKAFEVLVRFQVRQVGYVPDAGHAPLINHCANYRDMTTVPLTTEEEGVGVITGAWLGRQRGALLMQSSGVGNCINMFSVAKVCEIPLLMLVTMRGETGETNPWQVPMGENMERVLTASGVDFLYLSAATESESIFSRAADLAFNQSRMVAVCIGQAIIGIKEFQEQ